ncbi:MAG: YdcF family protein [Pseudomonadota bacterium]|nr:YdcF family protein [Pseudomonadota bacterium]
MRTRLLVVLSILALAWAAGALTLDTWGKSQEPRGAYDALIVAGCRVYPDGRPSPALEWRVRKAVGLWKAGIAPRIVFTGGLGDHPPTEAEASAKLAGELGVPRSAMVLEDRSTSTDENARNAAKALGVEGASARVLVVTDAYHVFRARRVFDRYFGEVDAVGSTYGRWTRIRGALREVLAVTKYGLLRTL